MVRRTLITQAELMNQLHYNLVTGGFTWLVDKKRRKKGDTAGFTNKQGYSKITVNGEEHPSHRLAFLYMIGYMPEQVDHINRCRSDNRWCNLRQVTHAQNHQNRPSTSGLGIRNVHKHGQGFRVKLHLNGRNIYCGTYPDLELAELVAIEARNKYFTHHTE